MSSADDDARKQELLRLDILLRRKQVLWETPRGILLMVATTAALIGAGAGFVGFKIGQTPPQPIVIQMPSPK
jgi:hypothetical protein